MQNQSRIAVITVSYNHGRFLKDLFESLKKIDYPPQDWKFFLVDNGSSDETALLAKKELIDETNGVIFGTKIKAEFIGLPVNIGFTGGNNLVFSRVQSEGFDYVFLLNPDTKITTSALTEAVRVMESDSKIAIAQSLLLLADEPNLINSWGNEVHFLGFSFCGGYRIALNDPCAISKIKLRDIASASGAAMMIRFSALKTAGGFDENMFAYHEDVDLSWRMRLAGFRIVLAPESIVYHRYEFSRSIKKFYFMEKNRFWTHLKNLKIGTLILLAPIFILVEIGLWLFAFKSGFWREKWRAVRYFFSSKNRQELFRQRRQIQKSRVIGDRQVCEFFSASLSYQDVRNILWDYVGNPICAAYWFMVRLFIFW